MPGPHTKDRESKGGTPPALKPKKSDNADVEADTAHAKKAARTGHWQTKKVRRLRAQRLVRMLKFAT